MEDVVSLLQCAKSLSLRVKGVAFHTGSGGVQYASYESSIVNARKIFDMALELGMQPMDLLDIGGGFTLIMPNSSKNFDEVAPRINTLLETHFPEDSVQIIAEPGRYICESVVYLASCIIGQKTLKSGNRHYYLNNGIYQGYMVRMFGEDMEIEPLDPSISSRPSRNSTWWGQTCDSCDWVIKNKEHPEYETGEWVLTCNHGAYHKEFGCTFNGFELPSVFYIF